MPAEREWRLYDPMPSSTPGAPILEFHAVTVKRLADLVRFSEQHRRFRYCSCMRWRMTSTDYHRSTTESRVAALEEIVRHRCDAPHGTDK